MLPYIMCMVYGSHTRLLFHIAKLLKIIEQRNYESRWSLFI